MHCRAIGLVVVAMLAGCAQALPGGTPTPRKVSTDDTGTFDGRVYALSAEEQRLDCKKLSGRMQVRILQIRDSDQRPTGNFVTQGTQMIVAPILGGTTHGTDPAGALARDRAMLEAYNARLKEKNCQTFDLDKELAIRDVRHTPRPQPKS